LKYKLLKSARKSQQPRLHGVVVPFNAKQYYSGKQLGHLSEDVFKYFETSNLNIILLGTPES